MKGKKQRTKSIMWLKVQYVLLFTALVNKINETNKTTYLISIIISTDFRTKDSYWIKTETKELFYVFLKVLIILLELSEQDK